MSLPIRSTNDILAALREHPEWKDEVRREILSEDLLELPARFSAAEARFAAAEVRREEDSRRVWEAIGKLTERMDRLTERVDQLTERVDQLAEAQQRTEATLKAFMEATEKRFRGIELDLDYVMGKSMEVDVTKKLGNYLRHRVRKIRRCDPDTIDSMIDTALDNGDLTEREGDDLGDADVLVAGRDRESGKLACVAVEVSKTVDKSDVDRAARRAQLFLKAASAAAMLNPTEFLKIFPEAPEKSYALVVGRRILEEAHQQAERKGVLFAKYANGHDRERR